ncbi:MAG: hypothetical protein GY858_04345 [Candidatus Omnitrophica bacterium]|nr:hypothetical protein [Candidatus Omnitrophota bacterium]
MNDLIKYPGWKNALDEILIRIEKNGYGCLILHDELKQWLSLEEPKTIEEYKKHEFEYMSSIEKLKEDLLLDHSVYLMNMKGQGYQVLIPEEQVTRAPDKHTKKASAELRKAARALSNVKTELLSVETENLRLSKMARIAFLKTVFSKRKIPIVDKKQIIESVV